MMAEAHLVDLPLLPLERCSALVVGLDEPATFCYPIGHHDAASRRQVRASGMVLAFTTAYGALERTGDAMRAPRIRVSRGESASNVLRKLQPYASGLP